MERRNLRKYKYPVGPNYEYYVGQLKPPEQIVAGIGETNRWINMILFLR